MTTRGAAPGRPKPPPSSAPVRLARRLGVILAGALLLLIAFLVVWVAGSRARLHWVEEYSTRQAAPPQGQWIHAHDANIHFQEFGRKEDKPLVLVHGTGAWAGTWASNVQAMANAGYRVIAIDLPPFGFSQHSPDTDYSRGAQARRILALIKGLGLGPVTLLGHSFGGGPAAEAAMLGSEHIAHLVLVDAAIGLRAGSDATCRPPAGLVSLLAWRPLRTALVATAGTNPLFSQFWLRQFVARKEVVTASRTAIYQQPFVTQDFSAGLGDWAWQFATGCEEPASVLPESYRRLSVPVSLVWGDEDTITPLAQAHRLQGLLPRSRLTVLGRVGHIPQIEDVALFNRRIADVLKSPP